MSGRGHPALPGPCPRCTGLGDAHYLTCPVLRLPPKWNLAIKVGPGAFITGWLSEVTAVPP